MEHAMNVDAIREFCLKFPGVTEKLQWGDALCFKVAGKMFAVLGLDNLRLTFKCTPEVFAELIERENIRPSPYVGRYHWVLLERLDALGDRELRELVQRSYEIVAAKAPARTKSRRVANRASSQASQAKTKKRPNKKLRRS
jgi:predicted DNA-binding protein (MmcQ/YjbR family)